VLFIIQMRTDLGCCVLRSSRGDVVIKARASLRCFVMMNSRGSPGEVVTEMRTDTSCFRTMSSRAGWSETVIKTRTDLSCSVMRSRGGRNEAVTKKRTDWSRAGMMRSRGDIVIKLRFFGFFGSLQSFLSLSVLLL
jgi:hypothetical protein